MSNTNYYDMTLVFNESEIAYMEVCNNGYYMIAICILVGILIMMFAAFGLVVGYLSRNYKDEVT